MYWHADVADGGAGFLLLHRRELWRLIAVIALAGCGSEQAPPASTPTKATGATKANHAPSLGPRPWSDAVHNCLAAACATILPAGTGFAAGVPNASDTGVIEFIARQLSAAPLARLAPAFIALAGALEAYSQANGATSFAHAKPAVREAAISALAQETLPTKLPQLALFKVLRSLVLEGLLADPTHGGNRNASAWTAFGLAAQGAPHHHGTPHKAP